MDGNHARVVLYRGREKDEICRMDIVYSSISSTLKRHCDIYDTLKKRGIKTFWTP